jgi:Ser/Thr protein kinase RdoA (MazF antagonist)
MHRLARAALERYTLPLARLSLLRHASWGTTFRVDCALTGQRFLLRIHSSSVTSPVEASFELQWLLALHRDTDLPVPVPVLAKNGALTVQAEASGVDGIRHCALLRWLPGRRMLRHPSQRAVRDVGAFVARLHLHAERYQPPAGTWRKQLDPTGVARQWLVPATPIDLPKRDQDAVRSAAGKMLDDASALTARGPNSGIIHADFHPWNVLLHQGQVRAIDFADCGFGPFAYDLGVWITQVDIDKEHGLDEHYLAGYRSVRALPPDQLAQVDACVVWRLLEDLDWLLEHAYDTGTSAWIANRLPKVLRVLRRFAAGSSLTTFTHS